MKTQIILTVEEIAEATQGNEDVIERIDYLKEFLEERRKQLEDIYMGCQEEYAMGDVMNLLDLVKSKFEEAYDQSINTFFHGDFADVTEFIADLRALLKRHVSVDFDKAEEHESDSENAWTIQAYVSEKEIEEYNLEMDWTVFRMKNK